MQIGSGIVKIWSQIYWLRFLGQPVDERQRY